jgi:hypothetical protein
MVATGLVDCRVVVVVERFGFLCFAILGGGKACWCRWKAVLVQLFVRCESLVEALLLLLLWLGRRLGGVCRLDCTTLGGCRLACTTAGRLSLSLSCTFLLNSGLYDGSEESVAWLVLYVLVECLAL